MFESHSAVQKYLTLEFVEFLEIFCGYGQLTLRVAESGIRCGEGIDSKALAYGQTWCLDDAGTASEFAWLVVFGLRPRATHTGTPCTKMCIIGQRDYPEFTKRLVNLACMAGEHQLACGFLHSNEQPKGSLLMSVDEWTVVCGDIERMRS